MHGGRCGLRAGVRCVYRRDVLWMARDLRQVGAQVVGALVAHVRVLLQALQHDPLEPGVDVGVLFARQGRILLDVLAAELEPVAASERSVASRHLVERDAQRIDIGAMIDALAPGLLGRHVLRCANVDGGPGRGRVAVGGLGYSEIGDDGVAVAIEEDVVGLQVAVDDPAFVRVGELERGGHVHPDFDDHLVVEHFAALHEILEAGFQQIHREEDDVVILPGVVDGHDVGVAELCGAVGLFTEVLLEHLVVGERRLQHLERHVDVEVRIPRLVDVGKSPLTEEFRNPVDRHLAA